MLFCDEFHKPMIPLPQLKRKALRALFRYDPSYNDMFTDKSEAYFARLYLYQMKPYLEQLEENAKIMDAGCQAGRFTIPLAKMGFGVTGLDTSPLSLDRAKMHCRKNGIRPHFIRGEISRVCERLPAGAFDLVICSEVLYLYPHFETLMKWMMRVLKPDGFLVTSHRTKFYYLTKALLRNDLETAQFIVKNREGSLWGTYFNWQTVEELKTVHEKLGVQTQGIHPIGIFSEISFAPGELSLSQQDKLFEIEKEPFDEVTGCTRYLLAVGKKLSNSYSDLS